MVAFAAAIGGGVAAEGKHSQNTPNTQLNIIYIQHTIRRA